MDKDIQASAGQGSPVIGRLTLFGQWLDTEIQSLWQEMQSLAADWRQSADDWTRTSSNFHDRVGHLVDEELEVLDKTIQ